jgi:hypothetical protein
MQLGKGIAIGFIAGLAVAAGAFSILRLEDGGSRLQDDARLAVLDAQMQRLERVVSRLQRIEAAGSLGAPARADAGPARAVPPVPEATRSAAQVQAIAVADTMVDRALQSGQWTHEQAAELNMAVSRLDREEHGRILARVSAAINAGQLQVELP